MKTLLAALVAMTLLGGCVSQDKADNLLTSLRQCQTQLVDLRAQLEEANAQIADLQQARRAPDPATLAQVESLKAERQRLAQRIEELEQQVRTLAQTDIALPPEVDAALAELAQQHQQIMTYDAAAGMVKLRSDLTFDLGSAKVSPAAEQTLTELAGILENVVANGYELRVVGHTDNVPIKRGPTRAVHPTNWHLSVHRAIAVRNVLDQAGVPPVYTSVAGYGEYRPVEPNTRRGNAANRRVEIYISPSTHTPLDTDAAATTTQGGDNRGAGTVAPEPAPAPAEPVTPEPFK